MRIAIPMQSASAALAAVASGRNGYTPTLALWIQSFSLLPMRAGTTGSGRNGRRLFKVASTASTAYAFQQAMSRAVRRCAPRVVATTTHRNLSGPW